MRRSFTAWCGSESLNKLEYTWSVITGPSLSLIDHIVAITPRPASTLQPGEWPPLEAVHLQFWFGTPRRMQGQHEEMIWWWWLKAPKVCQANKMHFFVGAVFCTAWLAKWTQLCVFMPSITLSINARAPLNRRTLNLVARSAIRFKSFKFNSTGSAHCPGVFDRRTSRSPLNVWRISFALIMAAQGGLMCTRT